MDTHTHTQTHTSLQMLQWEMQVLWKQTDKAHSALDLENGLSKESNLKAETQYRLQLVNDKLLCQFQVDILLSNGIVLTCLW
jgi:hypothetical protein